MSERNKRNKRKYKHVGLAVTIAFVIYVVMDLFNISQKLNIPISNINMDLFGSAASAAVVFAIFFLTYNEIDARQIEKENNARDTADVLIVDTYKECLNTLDLVENRENVEKYIVPKVDFDKQLKDDETLTYLQNSPFSNFDKIIALAEDGYLSKEKLKDYLWIKNEFAYVVSGKIIFYDIEDAKTEKQILFREELEKRDNDLRKRLGKKINV